MDITPWQRALERGAILEATPQVMSELEAKLPWDTHGKYLASVASRKHPGCYRVWLTNKSKGVRDRHREKLSSR